jgi:hypothetical protein
MGSGFEVISVGKRKLVRSVPTELNKDHNEILELAQVTSIFYFLLPSNLEVCLMNMITFSILVSWELIRNGCIFSGI